MMKTMAIFLMLLAHVALMYGTPAAIASDLSYWLAFTSEGMGAPAFIFAMGASIILSARKTTGAIILRGLILFISGYILNVLKFYPTIVWFHTFPKELFEATGRLNDLNGLIGFLTIADILQFAAIAYVICAFLSPLVNRFRLLGILLALFFFLLAPSLYTLDTKSKNYALQLLYGQNFQVYFPLFPWLGFALLGLSVGSWVRYAAAQAKRLWFILLLAGLILLAIGLFLIDSNQALYFGSDYYHRGIGGLIMYSGELLFFLSIFHLITPYLSRGLRLFFIFCSRNVLQVYSIQWILICWCWYFIPYGTQPWSRLWIYFPLFTFLTLLLATLWAYLLRWVRYVFRSRRKEPIIINVKK